MAYAVSWLGIKKRLTVSSVISFCPDVLCMVHRPGIKNQLSIYHISLSCPDVPCMIVRPGIKNQLSVYHVSLPCPDVPNMIDRPGIKNQLSFFLNHIPLPCPDVPCIIDWAYQSKIWNMITWFAWFLIEYLLCLEPHVGCLEGFSALEMYWLFKDWLTRIFYASEPLTKTHLSFKGTSLLKNCFIQKGNT